MSNENKKPQQQHPAPDPRTAEAQIYTRIEAARRRIAGAVNTVIRETGLPTAIVLELLRGIVSETALALERAAHEATLKDLAEAKEE